MKDCPDDLKITGNRKHLSRALFNLVDNAIKYTPNGGIVRIAAASNHSPGKIEIIVEDNGIGIQFEEIDRIFDRFYRVDKARSQTRGTGLGLSIAREIVKAHEGLISVESTPGEGSTFKITLPSKIKKL